MSALIELLVDDLRCMYHTQGIQRLREKKIRISNTWLDEELKKNIQFKNKYNGKRCFILGNGPSLASVDFSRLATEYTFTVNQISRNKRFHELKTNFHMWSDERLFMIDKSRPEDLDLIESMKLVSSENNHPVVFYKSAAKHIIEEFELHKYLDIRYFEQGWYRLNANSTISFTNFTPAFSTVVHYLICLAVYMGFTEIYLLGCDCTSVVNIANAFLKDAQNSLYAYDISSNEKKRIERIQARTTVKEELASSLRLFEDYEILYKYCINNNVRLFNASSTTLLDSVPRVQLENVLNN